MEAGTVSSLASPPADRNVRILVIDDCEPDRRQLVADFDPDDGLLFEAIDGESGLALARALRPDLILTELWLPDMDGFELLKALKEAPETRPVPVILISSALTGSDRTRAQELAALDSLSKPCDVRVLRDRIRAVRRHKAVQALLELPEYRDDLTGLGNAEAVRAQLKADQETCGERDVALSVVLLTLEGLPFAETASHTALETLIRGVGQVLRTAVRSTDFVGCRGLGRFVVIAPECDYDNARRLSERLRRLIRLRMEQPDMPPFGTSVRVALGVGASDAEDSDDEDASVSVLELAERDLASRRR